MIKVLHINTGAEGGAGLCARRITNALMKQGIDSRMLFAYLSTSETEGDSLKNVKYAIAQRDKEFWYSNSILGKIKHLLMRMPWYMDEEKMKKIIEEKNIEHLYLHQPYSSYKNISHHPLIEWADIIHLHWVSEFVDYPTFFKDVKKPIVWTLHDMYPAIGIMHFESHHTVRPHALDEIDSMCRKIKRYSVKQAQQISFVAISDKMEGIIKMSEVLKGFPVTKIHNGVDTSIFRPIDTKKRLFKNINSDTVVFLFSSCDINDNRKGINRVIKALEGIKLEGDKKVVMIAIGKVHEENKPIADFPIHFAGLINEQTELSRLYSTADFFINASFEEAFAQTPLEAMACGTPVISTPCSGASDLIRPFNGVICQGYDSEALKEGILKAISTNYDSKTIRDYIIENFDYSKIAKQYIELYNSILNK